MRALVASLPVNWNIDSATAPPNFNFNGSIGDTWGPFGINLAGVYGWKFNVHRDADRQRVQGPAADRRRTTGDLFTYDVSDFKTQLGALLSSQYQIDPDHKILARALVNRQANDEVQSGRGHGHVSISALDQFSTSSEYTANQLGFGGLEGVDHFSWIDVDWRGSWAPSSQQIPDAKYYDYNG